MDEIDWSRGRYKMVCRACPDREPAYHRTREGAHQTKEIHDGLVHGPHSVANVVECEQEAHGQAA